MRVAILALAAVIAAAAEPAAAPDRFAEHAAFAPEVQPKLLFFSLVGGPGEQWFNEVEVKGRRVAAGMAKGKLGLAVTVGADDAVKATVLGDRNAIDHPETDLPNGGRTGPYTWGYKQVNKNLQQPFLTGAGLELWGWSFAQASTAKVQYGAMADSRIRALWQTPRGSLLAVGSCDGGNTILRADPRDRDRTLPLSFSNGGGGGGRASWLIDLRAADGQPLGVIPCRGAVVCHAYDAWNRLIVGGGAVNAVGAGAVFGYQDGAGVLMTDYGWTRPLLSAHLGAKEGDKGIGGMAWALAIDSDSGLLAVAGWMQGSPVGVAAVQPANGGGRDAFLAVVRLWSEADAKASREREAEARKGAKTK